MELNSNVTRVVYFINDQDTPYLVKLNIPLNQVTLADFKTALKINKKSYKYFFKSLDDDFGVVKEEIFEDNAKLPLFKNRVVAWLVSSDINNSNEPSSSQQSNTNQNQINRNSSSKYPHSDCDTTETESILSEKHDHRFNGHKISNKNQFNHRCCNNSTGLTSDFDSTTFVDTDDDESYYQTTNHNYELDEDDYENENDSESDNMSHFTATTEETSISKVAQNRLKKKKKLLHMAKMQARASSTASVSDSSVSLDVITVTLNLAKNKFLGISIYGQSYTNGDNGIYVGSIMTGGVVQEDGRINVGDMILQVNEVNFENLSNDEAVSVLRKAVSKPGLIKLVVAKHCWLRSLNAFGKPPTENNEETMVLRNQPVRPIDPRAWVEHTKHFSSNDKNNLQDSELNNIQLTTKLEMLSIARAMSTADSGLEIKNRTWLKITIPNAFLGSEVVNWLYNHVQGFNNRKEAKKYATNMLKNGYIKHTINKNKFSEQCYYTFSDSVVFIPDLEKLKITDSIYEKAETEYDNKMNSQLNLDSKNPQFLPWAQNTVSYGLFENCPNLQENSIHMMASSCSDQISQKSGPINLSTYKNQEMQMKNQMIYQNSFQNHQQHQAQTLLQQPPFAPQPNSSMTSNFFNHFESNMLRKQANSSNSSETQSSLNTISTRDTAIGLGSNNAVNSNLQQNLESNINNNGYSNIPRVNLNNHPSLLIGGSDFIQN